MQKRVKSCSFPFRREVARRKEEKEAGRIKKPKKMMQMFGLRSSGRAKPDDADLGNPTSTFESVGGEGVPAKALRLVLCDERGRFKMDPEAVAALQLVKGPLGVVSVCGRARQGKSFILNQVSNK